MSDGAGPLVLYVEDEALILEMGVVALEEAGFQVTARSTGPEGMAELNTRGAELKAVITDIDLPGGVSGWDIAKHARELWPDMPIIYVTGGSSNDWPSMGVPGSIIVIKPYAAAQLVVAVSTVLLGNSGQATAPG